MHQKWFIFLSPLLVALLLGGIYLHQRRSEASRSRELHPVMNLPEDTALPSAEPSPENATGRPRASEYSTPPSGIPLQDDDQETVWDDRIPTEQELLQAAAALTENPFLRKLLAQETTLRLLVRFLEATAHGELPRALLLFLGDFPPFQAALRPDGTLTADTATMRRFTPFIEAVTAIPPEKCAAWYLKAEPRLQKILSDMGAQDESIRLLTADTLEILLQAPLPDDAPALSATGIPGRYDFQNPAYQNLYDLQKAFLRLGPQNSRKLHEFLQALQKEITAVPFGTRI